MLTANQGEKVSVKDGIRHHYHMKLNPGSEGMPWRTQIVRSSLPPKDLPPSMHRDGWRAVCQVEAGLNTRDMKLKNRHWYNCKPKYWLADFDVKVIVGSADLRFEMSGKDGVISKTHEQIAVQWAAVAQQAAQMAQRAATESFDMYE